MPDASASDRDQVAVIEEILGLKYSEGHRAIYSIIGPNGSGKSRFLKALAEECQNRFIPYVTFPATRSSDLHSNPSYSSTQTPYDSELIEPSKMVDLLLSAETHSRRLGSHNINYVLDYSLAGVLAAAMKLDSIEANEHRAALHQWVDLPKPRPPEPESRLAGRLKKTLSVINKIVGKDIYYQFGDSVGVFEFGHFLVRNVDGDYYLSQLSDGEKQILALSAYLLGTAAQRFVCLVDEPELRLNEAKAIEIWENMERALPNVIFIYATHSPAFATRAAVNQTWTISSDAKMERVPDTSLSSETLRSLVGTRVQLLRSDLPCILCEDELSKAFLEDIFVDQKVRVVNAKGKDLVMKSLKAQSGWTQLMTTSARLCGVIDLDERGSSQIQHLKKNNIFTLPINETESILIHPKVALKIVGRFQAENVKITPDAYEKILKTAALNALDEALRKHIEFISYNFTAEMSYKRNLDAITDLQTGSLSRLHELIKERSALIFMAYQTDTAAIVRLFPGKELYGEVRKLIWNKYKIRLQEDADRPPQEWSALRYGF